jgi:PAS domain S-box-containing protein
VKPPKEKEDRYRKVYEHSGDSIVLTDSKGVVLEGNYAAEKLLLQNNAALNGHSIAELISSEAEAILVDSFIQKKGVKNRKLHFKNLQNEEIDCLLSCWIHVANAGICILILQDVSQLKYNQLQQLAIEKLESNERIAQIIAHEVRNPLTNINLSLENIEEEIKQHPSEEMLLYLTIIKRNSLRINLLITELLNSTRVEEPRYTSSNIHSLIDEALKLAEDRINLKNIAVIRNYTHENCSVNVDGEKIKIALLNLIINATEAMVEKKGTLTVSTENHNGKCVIKLTDNGPGIPKEYLPRLFDPFFSKKQNGTGLGLTSVQSIIHSHKGTIHVKSEIGKGTTFRIDLELI